MSAGGYSVPAGAVTGVADRGAAAARAHGSVVGRGGPEPGTETVVPSPGGPPDALREAGREIVHATRE